jgi:hypothetical protein
MFLGALVMRSCAPAHFDATRTKVEFRERSHEGRL